MEPLHVWDGEVEGVVKGAQWVCWGGWVRTIWVHQVDGGGGEERVGEAKKDRSAEAEEERKGEERYDSATWAVEDAEVDCKSLDNEHSLDNASVDSAGLVGRMFASSFSRSKSPFHLDSDSGTEIECEEDEDDAIEIVLDKPSSFYDGAADTVVLRKVFAGWLRVAPPMLQHSSDTVLHVPGGIPIKFGDSDWVRRRTPGNDKGVAVCLLSSYRNESIDRGASGHIVELRTSDVSENLGDGLTIACGSPPSRPLSNQQDDLAFHFSRHKKDKDVASSVSETVHSGGESYHTPSTGQHGIQVPVEVWEEAHAAAIADSSGAESRADSTLDGYSSENYFVFTPWTPPSSCGPGTFHRQQSSEGQSSARCVAVASSSESPDELLRGKVDVARDEKAGDGGP